MYGHPSIRHLISRLLLKRPPPGVRVTLGDTDGPAMTEMLIFGEALSSSTSATSLTIRAARITPATRAPRPDDPTPRKPPLQLLTRKQTIGELAVNTRIKVNANGKGEDSEVKRKYFKVPALPENHTPDADVLGLVSDPKGKTRAVDEGIGDIEQDNKSIIKKFTVRHLEADGVSKTHPEFKEVLGFVYRGTAFALRATVKKSPVTALALDTLVEAHIELYTPLP
ncbi:hypothetical protein DFH29DRAFT_1056421 [Suillus ampliporus]|nr:hypothetical protein DFH29DRAFT_1056421 [Suillus ampliporus]